MSQVLSQASYEWMSRPADERFVGFDPMIEKAQAYWDNATRKVVSTRAFEVQPVGTDHQGLAIVGKANVPYLPTNWAFNQICQRAGAPSSYFRDSALPTEIVADCLNWGLRNRQIEEVGLTLYQNGSNRLAAMTGPNYGLITNLSILKTLRKIFGDGLTGHWRIPGEFGKAITYTTENTTMFMSDRDMFIFLADEDRRIEIPGRRAGLMGTFARGWFLKNSEVGSTTLDLTGFFYDYTCCNRNVWGVEGVKKISLRHTSGAPDRWLYESLPALKSYSESSTKGLEQAIKERMSHKLGGKEEVEAFLAKRFTKSQASAIITVHEQEEGRPIETLWDAGVGATAYARQIPYQNERVKVEVEAGKMMG